jgi:hypothetical protein
MSVTTVAESERTYGLTDRNAGASTIVSLLPAFILLGLLLVTAYAPLPWYLLLVQLAAMWYLSFRHLAERATFERRMWLELYLLSDSDWRKYLAQTNFLQVVAAAFAAVLAVITYLSLYAKQWFLIISIVAMIALADFLCRTAARGILKNLVKPYAEIIRHRLSAMLAIALVLTGLCFANLCDSLFYDYSQETARTIAHQTIDDVKHPVRIARHWVRTIHYYDLTLLRIRDTLGWPLGWCVYLALLIPSALPAAGSYSIYRGIKIILSESEVSQCEAL